VKLPPMNALRAFEAVGRTAGLAEAAAELGVTPGAISRQLGILKEFFRTDLYIKQGRRLVMTRAAQAYANVLTEAFQRIDLESRLLFPTAPSGNLNVCCAPNFAMRWLAPRLAKFQTAQTGIDVHLRTLSRPPAVEGEQFDLAVTEGPGPWKGFAAQRLLRSPLVAICSPSLLDRRPDLQVPGDLRPEILIHAMDRLDDWPRWLRAAGLQTSDLRGGTQFENSNLAYQATLTGLGLMISHRPLVDIDLRSGRLVIPFDIEVEDAPDYYVLFPERADRRRELKLFLNWLLQEADPHTPASFTIA
jgi:LysR family glycine cleavage system transcriptional activator